MQARQRLIVSLDVDRFEYACKLIDILSPEVECFKVGIAPFTLFGEELLNKLRQANKKVFLDLKFHDIPNTVKQAAKAAALKHIYMMNFHCLGGLKMMQEAVKGVLEVSGSERPLLIGVTILTSMSVADMQDLGMSDNVQAEVIKLAKLAKQAGLDGVVASAKEAKVIKENVGEDFLIVAPGVRPLWSVVSGEDQKRVLSPKQAVSQGADFIVVGRPIIKDSDPLQAAKRIISELEEVIIE